MGLVRRVWYRYKGLAWVGVSYSVVWSLVLVEYGVWEGYGMESGMAIGI